MTYPVRPHQRRKRGEERHAVNSAVTTNDEESAEAIVVMKTRNGDGAKG